MAPVDDNPYTTKMIIIASFLNIVSKIIQVGAKL
jgi:hypothetical protein